ncbi:hypothetical protein [Pseudoalteromonas piscicida]|uniref:hypothetical protein n=1 Tax=Pseudoalteromonas piscicida TaxID=43662 RepID=UPI000E3597EC|nr:hypothetical protein [Pseudoalteromonas piscicida]AXQ99038.1 hypothetical protein D0N37_15805 [Pseudoalteromonas piscicida]
MMLSKVFNFSLVFLAVLGVNFSFVPIDAHRLYYLYSLIALFIVYFYSSKKFFFLYNSLVWLRVVFIYLLAMILSLVVPLYNGTTDLTFFRMGVDYVLTLVLFCPAVYYLFSKNNFKADTCIDLIIKISFVQSVFIISMLLLPDFQAFMFKIITTNGAHIRFESDFRFRAVGVTGFTSYTMAVFQCFSLYLFHLVWQRKQSSMQFYTSISVFLCILASSIISARTSFVFLVPLLFLFFIALFIKSEQSFFKRKVFYFFLLYL